MRKMCRMRDNLTFNIITNLLSRIENVDKKLRMVISLKKKYLVTTSGLSKRRNDRWS